MNKSTVKSNKILIVFTIGFKTTSGITNAILNYYNEMDKNKYQIDFASFTDLEDSTKKYLASNNSKYYKLPNRKKHPFCYAAKLLNICKRYNVVHVNGNSPTMVLELLPTKLAGVEVRIAHCHTSVTQHPIVSRILMPIFKSTYTMAIACSDKAGDWIFGSGNFIFLPNSIKPEDYQVTDKVRSIKRKELKVQDRVLLGHVGRFSPEKNHTFLIEVFEQYKKINPDSSLILIGDGPEMGVIKKMVNEKKLKDFVIFTGAVSNVKEYLCAVDVFVFPSIYEGLPLSVVEAQAMNIDCIISDSITNNVKITDHVYSLSLTMGADYWARKIADYHIKSSRANSVNKEIVKSLFNIHNSVVRLEKIYDGSYGFE